MKVKILSYEKIDNANVNITFDILKNDGSVLLHVERRGFTSTADTLAEARAQIIQSLKNIRDVYQNVQASKLDALVSSAVGTEVDIA